MTFPSEPRVQIRQVRWSGIIYNSMPIIHMTPCYVIFIFLIIFISLNALPFSPNVFICPLVLFFCLQVPVGPISSLAYLTRYLTRYPTLVLVTHMVSITRPERQELYRITAPNPRNLPFLAHS